MPDGVDRINNSLPVKRTVYRVPCKFYGRMYDVDSVTVHIEDPPMDRAWVRGA